MRTLLLTLWLALAFGLAAPAWAADTGLSNPQPTIDNPRKVVLTLSDDDPGHVNTVITNVANIQKFYGADYVRIALIAYGPGVKALLKGESPVAARIEGLLAIDIEVIACENSLAAYHKTAADLLPGVKIVPAGLAEVVERQLRGWVYLHP